MMVMPAEGSIFRSGSLRRTLWRLLALAALWQFGPEPLLAQSSGQVTITNRYANLRSGPGTHYTRVGQALRGERFQCLGRQEGWHQIMYRGGPAWVFGELARLEPGSGAADGGNLQEMGRRIEDLNRRMDRVLDKIDRTGSLLAEGYLPQGEPGAGATSIAEMLAEPAAGRLSRDSIPAGEAPLAEVSPEKVRAGKPNPAWLLVPGGARLAAGSPGRGWSMLALTAASAGAGYYFRREYDDLLTDYRALPPEAPTEEFTRRHDRADRKLRLADGCFYAAGGVFAFHLLDYFLLLPDAPLALEVRPSPGGGNTISLSMTCGF